MPPVTRLVLDTNVLLDWLVFGDPGVRPLVAAIEQGRAVWLADHAMREEFERVLAYPAIAPRVPDPPAVLARWQAYARIWDAPSPLCPLRCRDADDQKFLDLALAAGARWLLTKDRQLLRLARPAARLGLVLAPPLEWTARPVTGARPQPAA